MEVKLYLLGLKNDELLAQLPREMCYNSAAYKNNYEIGRETNNCVRSFGRWMQIFCPVRAVKS